MTHFKNISCKLRVIPAVSEHWLLWCGQLHTCSLSSDCKRQQLTWYLSEWASSDGRGGEVGEPPSRLIWRESVRDCRGRKERAGENGGTKADVHVRNSWASTAGSLPSESCWAGPAAPERRCTERKHITHKVVCFWSVCRDAILSFQDHLINNPYSYPLWIFVCVWHAVTLCVRQRCCTCSTHTHTQPRTHTLQTAHTPSLQVQLHSLLTAPKLLLCEAYGNVRPGLSLKVDLSVSHMRTQKAQDVSLQPQATKVSTKQQEGNINQAPSKRGGPVCFSIKHPN